ncbi:MAG: hypothetical protein QXR38_04100, partial [Nitrososphaerales archaeon]
VLIPEKVRAPCEYSNLHNAIVVDEQKIGKLRFIALGRKLLKSLLRNRESVQTTHATWWLISYRDTRVLFIGDLNFEDVLTARHFVKTFYEKNFFLHGVLLPSFGGINGHGSNELQLSSEIKSFAQEMRDIYGTILAGLPHPVNAEWAHYNAIRLDSIVK